MLDQITPLILTYNEAPNIDRTLQQLTWAQKIIIIDSYSEDETLEIIQKYPQAQVFQRKFDTFANQCNFGLNHIQTEWALSLDADYLVTNQLVDELKKLTPESSINGYYARFKYCVFGKPLRGTILPPRQILYRIEKATYLDDGHAHRVQVKGESKTLKSYIHHDDRKPLSRWLWAQDRYMKIEVKKLLNTPTNELSIGDKIRKKKVFAPFIIFFYCLLLKRGILDGWQGWYYGFQRMLAETLLSIRLIEEESLKAK